MALTAVLEFGDNNIRRYSKQFMVADCRFVFDRSYNDFCPEGDTRCERMELFVVAPGKDDLTLFEWFADQSVLDGRITISLGATSDNSLDSQEIVFEEAVCFALSEMYDIESSMRRLLKLSILARKICIDDVCFE
jgi:hypothetical protein